MKLSSNSLMQIGTLLYSNQHTTSAIAVFEELISIEPTNRDAHIQLAYAYCRSGDYVRGGQEFIWIWKEQFGDQTGLLSRERNLENKTVLISCDAGLGDSIMFSRFANELKGRGCTVILQVQDSLVRLFKQSALADEVIGLMEGVLPKHDIRIPMHNLMASLCIQEVVPVHAYLSCPEEEIKSYAQQLGNHTQRRVGLCWAGNPSLPDDDKRSVSFEFLKSLTLQSDQLVSLIPSKSTDNDGALQSFRLDDISQTAALICSLDLIITVDTMVGHLGGALGIPTILLNRFNGCWRWGEEGSHSIWYESIKIKRQQQKYSW